jgi:23S rRNA pseudouridine2605 synthase
VGEGERLQKVLAATGWGSRRASEQLIAAGRVRVNGEVAVLGRRVDPETDLIEVDDPRVFPVGRLDADTEGLLLLTNDGELANRVAHPSRGVDKEYLAEVAVPAGGRVSAGAIRTLRDGVALDDGVTAPAKVTQPSPGVLRITIHEGRNRQIRRMCEAVGHPVRRLVRMRIGPLTDRRLQPGTWRRLTPAEVRELALATSPRTR